MGYEATREAIMTALIRIGNAASVEAILPFLRSQDAGIRAAAIEALQALPEPIAPFMAQLLSDHDSDVRLLATELARNLNASEATGLLCGLIERAGCAGGWALALERAPAGEPAALQVDHGARAQRVRLTFDADRHRCAGRSLGTGRSGQREDRSERSKNANVLHSCHPFPRGLSALWSEAGLLAYGPTRRAFPGTRRRPVAHLRLASPITVAGPHRSLTGFPSPPTVDRCRS